MKTYINAIEYYLPVKRLSNELLSGEFPEWSVDKISSKTGIINRHIVSENETSSDLAYEACVNLFNRNNIDKQDIDFIILCTQSPDFFLPTTACILQDRLGLRKTIGAFDFNLGCSGYVYGLGIADGLIKSGQAQNILLVTAETYSKFINRKDKSCRTIFGDGATATLLSSIRSKDNFWGSLTKFRKPTDGKGYDKLILKDGASRYWGKPARVEEIDENGSFLRCDSNIWMDGKAIFEYTMSEVPRIIQSFMETYNYTFQDIDLFVFHQANAFMLNAIRKKIGIPAEKFIVCIEDFGNTVSNTIPIALSVKREDIKNAKNVILCGFGVGLSTSICNILK